MRGKAEELHKSRPRAGITPARAGKRCRNGTKHTAGRDHPRACGEKCLSGGAVKRISGSPPRVRGKASALHSCKNRPGITPARAGKSRSRRPVLIVDRDHPRACGEKVAIQKSRFPCKGSPPRVRGKVERVGQIQQGPGITPARAGKSCSYLSLPQARRDHPRACGEKPAGHEQVKLQVGSPPRVRGKANRFCICCLISGITPARAGKRSSAEKWLSCAWDHPRACGEKALSVSLLHPKQGSPPRVRGKVCEGSIHIKRPGITPARAGKSRSGN